MKATVRLILTATCLIPVFSNALAFAGCLPADSAQVTRLREIALKTFDAICARNAEAVLAFIDPRSGMIFGGGDVEISFTKIKSEFQNKSGQLFCGIFGCKDTDDSVREHFSRVRRDNLVVSPKIETRNKERCTELASVTFADKTAKPDLGDPFMPRLVYVWSEKTGWRFSSFSSE